MGAGEPSVTRTARLDTMTLASQTVSQPRRTRSPRGQGEQLRDEILEVAERLLVETNDEAALSIRAIASAVGVTPPSIYLHFADRNDLLFAVCERHLVKLEEAIARAAEGIDDPWERVRRRGRAYLQWGLDNPEHYRVLMMRRPDRTPDRFVDERLADTTGLVPVSEDVTAALGADLPVAAAEALETTKVLWMMIHGVVSMFIAKPDFPFASADETYDRLFRLVRGGLTSAG